MKTITVSIEDARWLDEFFKDVPPTDELDLAELAESIRALEYEPD